MESKDQRGTLRMRWMIWMRILRMVKGTFAAEAIQFVSFGVSLYALV